MGLFLRPATLDAALALLAERPRTVLAGGTDHFPARVGHAPDEDILDITAPARPARHRAARRRIGASPALRPGAT